MFATHNKSIVIELIHAVDQKNTEMETEGVDSGAFLIAYSIMELATALRTLGKELREVDMGAHLVQSGLESVASAIEEKGSKS